MDRLKVLKNKIDELRSQSVGKRTAFPGSLWDEITTLSNDFPLSRLAKELGINSQNISRQIKKRGQVQLLEVPLSSQKNITLNLPHGITLRIDL